MARRKTVTATCPGIAISGAGSFQAEPDLYVSRGGCVSNFALASHWRYGALKGFHYVYVLVRESEKGRHYTGLTDDLAKRLSAHNSGQVPHTSKCRPWRVETAVAFRSPEKAARFEKYLKSHSGRAFAAKHF